MGYCELCKHWRRSILYKGNPFPLLMDCHQSYQNLGLCRIASDKRASRRVNGEAPNGVLAQAADVEQGKFAELITDGKFGCICFELKG